MFLSSHRTATVAVARPPQRRPNCRSWQRAGQKISRPIKLLEIESAKWRPAPACSANSVALAHQSHARLRPCWQGSRAALTRCPAQRSRPAASWLDPLCDEAILYATRRRCCSGSVMPNSLIASFDRLVGGRGLDCADALALLADQGVGSAAVFALPTVWAYSAAADTCCRSLDGSTEQQIGARRQAGSRTARHINSGRPALGGMAWVLFSVAPGREFRDCAVGQLLRSRMSLRSIRATAPHTSFAISRSLNFWILPVEVFGSSENTMKRGHL